MIACVSSDVVSNVGSEGRDASTVFGKACRAEVLDACLPIGPIARLLPSWDSKGFSAPSRPDSDLPEGRGEALFSPLRGSFGLFAPACATSRTLASLARKLGVSKLIGASSAEQKCKTRRNLEQSDSTENSQDFHKRNPGCATIVMYLFQQDSIGLRATRIVAEYGPTRRRAEIGARKWRGLFATQTSHNFKCAWA